MNAMNPIYAQQIIVQTIQARLENILPPVSFYFLAIRPPKSTTLKLNLLPMYLHNPFRWKHFQLLKKQSPEQKK